MSLNKVCIAAACFLVIITCVQVAYGQSLQPVGAGFDPWPLVVGVAIVGFIVGLVIWHKRRPAESAAALALATSKVHAELGRLERRARAFITVHSDGWTKAPYAPPPVAIPPPVPYAFFDPSPFQKTYASAFALAMDATKVNDGRAVAIDGKVIKAGMGPAHQFQKDPSSGVVQRIMPQDLTPKG